MRSTSRAGITMVLAVVLLSACSVRTQSEPESIDREDVPFGLTADDPPDDEAAPPLAADVSVYFVGPEGLVAAPRRATEPVSATDVLDLLVEGPSDVEVASGLRSELPAGTSVLQVARRGSTAVVDLGGSLESVKTRGGVSALAQLVYTLTELPQFDRAVFRFDGRRLEVPTGDGGLSSAPVSRDDYPPG